MEEEKKCNSPSPKHPCLCDCHREERECIDCLGGRHQCKRCINRQELKKATEKIGKIIKEADEKRERYALRELIGNLTKH